jgi:ribosome-binding factor A
MTHNVRAQKVQEMIKQEVSNIILNDLKDPRVKFTTVTAVEITSDLRSAKIYVSFYGNEAEKESSLLGLRKSLGFIRTEIGKRIRLRFTPELSLQVDKSLEYSEHIQKLLVQINK